MALENNGVSMHHASWIWKWFRKNLQGYMMEASDEWSLHVFTMDARPSELSPLATEAVFTLQFTQGKTLRVHNREKIFID